MNAALIASCGVHSRHQSQHHTTQSEKHHPEIVYKVNLRMYFDFEATTFPRYSHTSMFPGYELMFIGSADVPPMTFAKECEFTIHSKKCSCGIDRYIRDNIDRIKSSSYYYDAKNEILDMYTNSVAKEYGLIIDGFTFDKSYLKYEVRFAWEVSV